MADITQIPLDRWIVFAAIVVLVLVLAEVAYRLLRRRLDVRLGKRASKTVSHLLEYSIIALGLYVGIFWILQLDWAFFVASVGILGVGVAFASQQIMQNAMAGLLLNIDRRVQVEDWVEVVGNITLRPARVKEMMLTKTVLLDSTGKMYFVPNAILITSSLINYSRAGFAEVAIPFQVPAGQDTDRIRRMILEVADQEPKVLPNVPRREKDVLDKMVLLPQIRELLQDRPSVEKFQPRVLVTGVGPSSVELSIRIWIMEVGKRDDIVSDLLDHLLARLRQEGVLGSPVK